MATRMRYSNISCFIASATILSSIMHPEHMCEIDGYVLIAPILRGCKVEREHRCYLTFKQPASARKINTIYDLATLWHASARRDYCQQGHLTLVRGTKLNFYSLAFVQTFYSRFYLPQYKCHILIAIIVLDFPLFPAFLFAHDLCKWNFIYRVS